VKIYLIRHGDPDYANDTLTERGHQEARALAGYLAGQGITRVYASPMGRARDTARYTSDTLGIPVDTLPWTAELGVRATGEERRTAWDIHGHLIRNSDYLSDPAVFERIPTLPASEVRAILEQLRRDSDRFLSTLGYQRDGGIYRVRRSTPDRIALFAHGGLGLTWLSLLLEIPTPLLWSGFFLHTSSVTQILFDERDDGFATPRCIMMSALPHLYASGLEPSQAGIKANYT